MSGAASENTESFDPHSIPVIGIGTSAGGLEALEAFFKNVPDNNDAAFVVIQHLSPDYKSMMDELLGRQTNMDIYKVKDGIKIKANSIYLIPPRKNMTIFKDQLFLSDIEQNEGLNLPIDIFFRSMAKDRGRKAIGIILSGSGSDGASGTRAIKEEGGMIMVQTPETAKFNSMPRSSIAAGIVDYTLPPEQMPNELLNYLEHPFVVQSQKIEKILSSDEDTYTKILLLLRDHSGIDFSNYRQSTIIRRIEKRMSINRMNKIEEYIKFLSNEPGEIKTLSKEMLIGVTRFFREPESFEYLKKEILPSILRNYSAGDHIRFWSVGCSTGEEAYSLAIIIKEVMDEMNIYPDVKIFATDIDKSAIDFAGIGIYPESVISDVSAERASRFFSSTDNGFQVKDHIRRMVVFAPHNILSDPPFSKIDLIVCRNLLIYLKPDVQKRVLELFYYAMKEQGSLFLGSSESLGDLETGFTTVDHTAKIFRYKKGYTPSIKKQYNRHQTPYPSQSLHLSNRAQPRKQEKNYLEDVYDDILGDWLPPSIIINEQYEVYQTINQVTKYLSLPEGRINLNILKMLPKESAIILSSLLRRAANKKSKVAFDHVRLSEEENDKTTFQLTATPLFSHRYQQYFYLITFEKQDKKDKPSEINTEHVPVDQHYHEQVAELERELQSTRENLQATVEELETSNEELQSSNEELIASNEELQSTNEELQSVNEELYTVNAEHQRKIEELSELTNDMDNLLKSTRIGTLFLDKDLSIRKVSSVASSITNIMESDIGKPIQHFSLEHLAPELTDLLLETYETLAQKDIEFCVNEEECYQIKMLPYRTQENAIEGIAILFTNITKLYNANYQLKQEQDLLRNILDNSPLGKTMVDHTGMMTYVNKKGEEILGITQHQINTRSFDDVKWTITDTEGQPIPSEKLPFSLIKKSQKPLYDYQHYIVKENKEKILLSINGAPFFDSLGELKGVVFTLKPLNVN